MRRERINMGRNWILGWSFRESQQRHCYFIGNQPKGSPERKTGSSCYLWRDLCHCSIQSACGRAKCIVDGSAGRFLFALLQLMAEDIFRDHLRSFYGGVILLASILPLVSITSL